MGLSEYIPDEEYFFNMILKSIRYSCTVVIVCVVKKRKY